MANMKDIARLAGVSHGTVSNVINKKGNVSIDKIRLVEEAAARLGYNLNAQAQQLRKGSLQQVAIILPNIFLDGYHDFYITLDKLLTQAGYDSDLFLSDSIPAKEADCVQEALQGRPEFIVAISCVSEPSELYTLSTPVILLNQPALRPLVRQTVISFDYKAAAGEISARLQALGHHSVALFADPENTPADRFLVDTLLSLKTPKDLEFTLFGYDTRLVHNGAVDILTAESGFDAIVTSDLYRAKILEDFRILIDRDPLPIFSLASKRVTPSHGLVRFELDFALLAHRVFERITGPEAAAPAVQTVPAYGFSKLKQRQPAPPANKGEITLAILKSPTSDVLQVLAPHFRKATGIQLKIVALPYNELLEMASTSNLPFDLIRMDVAWKPVLEKKLCLPLKDYESRLAGIRKAILPAIHSAYVRSAEDTYLLPFDPSIQLLFYRKDLFADAKIRRLFYETHHQQLDVPRTFAEYDRLAAFFTRKFNPDSPTQYGITMTFGSTMVAACDFLPRLQNQGRELFDSGGNIRISTPAVAEALAAYTHNKKYASPDVHYWWNESMESFANGSTAMTIVFANHASRIINSRNSVIFDKVDSALVPGGAPLLGGGCIGISNQSSQVGLCIEFLEWVYSDFVSNLIALLGGHSPVATVYENEEILSLYPWIRHISQHFQVGSRLALHPEYARFDSIRFEQILGLAVRNASMGVIPPQEALAFAQTQYEKEFTSAAGT